MRYLITFAYHRKSNDELTYFSKVTEDGTTPDQIIAATFESQANLEFGTGDAAARNYRRRLAVVCVVPLRADYAKMVDSYVSSC